MIPNLSACRSIVRRSLGVFTLLCVCSLFVTLGTSSAYAAGPARTSSHVFVPPGFVQVTQQNFRQLMHSPLAHYRISPRINNTGPGPYLFTDNIYSVANGLYVSAELGYSGGNKGMLRARTNVNKLGPWEVFNWYGGFNNNEFEIQSNANSLFVTAELGYTGSNYAMLRARTGSNSLGPWEQFYLFTDNNGNDIIEFGSQQFMCRGRARLHWQ